MRTAVYAGSFDPLHFGHTSIIYRASKMFDRLLIAVSHNADKSYLFDFPARLRMTRKYVADCLDTERVQVVGVTSLIAYFAAEHGAQYLIRGVRNTIDLEYELAMMDTNNILIHGIQTVFLPARPDTRMISSSVIRSIWSATKDPLTLPSRIVPDDIAELFYTLPDSKPKPKETI